MVGCFLPIPILGGPLGLLCPVCSVPMIYKRANTDSWLIGCPTRDNDHNWKTFKCNQLNYEIALINSGAPRPIVSRPSDWGPRVSPQGAILPELPQQTTRHHPYNRQNKAKSPQLLCKRVYEGPLSQNHKKTANKNCASQYCVGCCHAYSSVECRQHPRPAVNVQPPPTANAHGLTDQQMLDLGITAERLVEVGFMQTRTLARSNPIASGSRRQGPASQKQPHKWAQASDSLGRRLPLETMAMLQRNRAMRDQAADRRATLVDENKVVTIHLWLNSDASQPIDAFFPQWPLFYLEQSELLLEAVYKVVGPSWNRALSVWDTGLQVWCDTLVNYPRRSQQPEQRTILVRLQNVVVPQTALPHYSAPGTNPTDPPASAFLSNLDLPPIFDTPSSPKSPDVPQREILSGQCESLKPELSPHSIKEPSLMGTVSPLPREATPVNTRLIDLTESPQLEELAHSSPVTRMKSPIQTVNLSPLEPQTEKASTSSAVRPVLRKGWPGSSLPIAEILAWYKDQHITGNAPERWKDHFGAQWEYVQGTMYRYRAWIGNVTYEKMFDKFLSLPKATVRDARMVYKDEFKKVSVRVKAEVQEAQGPQGVRL
ncbi:hypothetical protein DFH28DRAFT_935305 [Melampsora americana]|nr:hypothetical protein DFH28DRAFT_935305 [Melampsora americana]